MKFMSGICVENLTTIYLKEDIGYLRNLCSQHHRHMANLEKVLKFLRIQSSKVYLQLEKEYSQSELQRIISGEGIACESGETKKVDLSEATFDELLIMAYTQIDEVDIETKIR